MNFEWISGEFWVNFGRFPGEFRANFGWIWGTGLELGLWASSEFKNFQTIIKKLQQSIQNSQGGESCKDAYPEVASQPKILLITDVLPRRISSILYKTFTATLQRSEYIITILRLLLFSQATGDWSCTWIKKKYWADPHPLEGEIERFVGMREWGIEQSFQNNFKNYQKFKN